MSVVVSVQCALKTISNSNTFPDVQNYRGESLRTSVSLAGVQNPPKNKSRAEKNHWAAQGGMERLSDKSDSFVYECFVLVKS